MIGKDNQKSARIFQQRGSMDPIMERQLASELHCFRVIGELRYLLGALIQDGTAEECWDGFSKRASIYMQDPYLIDKVAAQRLLQDLYRDILGNPEMVRWLEQKFAEMDPANPKWMILKERTEKKVSGSMKTTEKPGSTSACLLFLELCQECDNDDKTMECLMDSAAPDLIAMALETPPIPPPGMDARKRHMKNVEEHQEYRQVMESAMETVKQAAAEDPRIIAALRESFKMTRFIGFPPNSTAKEDFAVMREEVDALLHAVETGEIDSKKKQKAN